MWTRMTHADQIFPGPPFKPRLSEP
jgi:hypothetical protein